MVDLGVPTLSSGLQIGDPPPVQCYCTMQKAVASMETVLSVPRDSMLQLLGFPGFLGSKEKNETGVAPKPRQRSVPE